MAKLNKFHYHEVIDRSALICDIIDYCLYSHPAMGKKMRKKLVKAQGLIYEISSMACEKSDNIDND